MGENSTITDPVKDVMKKHKKKPNLLQYAIAYTIFGVAAIWGFLAHIVYYIGTFVHGISFLMTFEPREAKRKFTDFSKWYG